MQFFDIEYEIYCACSSHSWKQFHIQRKNIEYPLFILYTCGVYCACDKPKLYYTRDLSNTTFDTVPNWNASMTLLFRFVDTFVNMYQLHVLFENNKNNSWN